MSNCTRLKASAMRTISAQWLNDAEVRALLDKHAKTAALVPDIDEAHEAICSSMGGDDASTLEAQIARLRDEGATRLSGGAVRSGRRPR